MAWTYSSLSLFDQCQHQWFLKNIEKSLPWVQSEAASYGTEMHSALEKAVQGNFEFTDRYKFLEPVVASINNIKGEKKTEYAISFKEGWEPTEWSDKLAWLKGRSDLTIFHPSGERIMIADYKFSGKPKASQYALELDTFCLLHFKRHPDVKRIDTALLWLKTPAPTSKKTYTKSQESELEDKILGKIARVEDAIESGVFPCKPTPLCGWCSASDAQCHYRGNYKK